MPKAILLVEDSQDDVALFRLAMERSGLANPIIVVRDGHEAIAYLKGEGKFADRDQHPMPQILLLDLAMPKVNGFQVLEWVHKQGFLNQMLVVVLSHFGATREINMAYELGAHSFLTKPVTRRDLINLAQHFAGHWEIISSDDDSEFKNC